MAADSRKFHKEHSWHRFFAACPRGLEDLLLAELQAAGIDRARAGVGGVRFEGDLGAGYLACLWSRVASRVLLLLGEVDAGSSERLHAAVMDLPWERHVPEQATLAVDFSGSSDAFRNTLFGARRVKDGIVDRLRSLRGMRPGVDLQEPGLRITARLYRERVALGIDLSGPSHRRGYRGGTGAAPLKENLAAAVLLRAGWPAVAARGGVLYDPLCGSGTLPIEAALIAAGAAPGEHRPQGSPQWAGHDRGVWERLRAEARARREQGVERLPPIGGADADASVLEHARAAATEAGLAAHLRFEQAALGVQRPPAAMEGRAGLLVCNPPWGERLGAGERLRELYAQLGRLVREQFPDWRAAILAAEASPVDQLGLTIKRDYRLRSGPIDCRLLIHDPAGRGARRAARADRAQGALRQGQADRAPAPPSAPSPEGVAMLANRLRKNLRRLRGWLAAEQPQCYRVYDADIPEYAVAVDRYADWVHVAEYAPPPTVDPARAVARLADVRAAVAEVFGVDAGHIVMKTRERQRGTRQYQRLGSADHLLEVREGPARLLVNLRDYLDTGLFLDHRPARRLIAKLAANRRFLNLFCYTASASVFAALGGARTTTSIDLSATYLEWAARNLALNGFTAPAHACERADCLRWLAEARGEWDLVFLDPPSFSNSARMRDTLDVQRDHVPLIREAVRLLAPGGILLFSTNRRGFRLDRAALEGFAIEDLSEASVDPDFRRGPLPHRLFRITAGT
jgi:23S rRNA (guanine2445-N2)-methyltransferase / 23S rRNA (guanine2069-N7)-methyltransferase